jgi:hypothetical protein
MDAEQARRRLITLRSRLDEITKRDPEQEVRGMAIPVVDAVINGSRSAIPDDDEVGRVVRDLIDPDAVAAGEIDAVRAVDLIHVVDQLLHSLPPEPLMDLDLGTTGGTLFPRRDFDF